MNLGKRKGTQPDYKGAIRYVDDAGKEHEVYIAGWVNKTRNGTSLVSISALPLSKYIDKCKELTEKAEKEKDASRQALRLKKQERIRKQAEAKALRAEGAECADMYFEVRTETQEEEVNERGTEKQGQPEKEES